MRCISGKPTKIQIIQVAEITVEVEDESALMPKRTIKEFWTLDNQYIGRLDPLDDYLALEESIKTRASDTFDSPFKHEIEQRKKQLESAKKQLNSSEKQLNIALVALGFSICSLLMAIIKVIKNLLQ